MKITFRKAQTILYASILVNIFLTLIKWMVGVLSGSIALLADAVHSFTDIFATVAVLFGLWLMRRKPSEHFPYGFYKAENLATLVVSVLILWSGFEILFDSLNKIFSPHVILRFDLAVAVSLGSAIISFIIAHYKEKVGYEIGSEALVSEGKHSKIDSFATFAVFIGITFSFLGFSFVEPLVAFGIVVYVIYLGICPL
ncbi:MAG: cation diffusion facilitator family transporter [Candidatus Asgardarchaeia archaeon]